MIWTRCAVDGSRGVARSLAGNFGVVGAKNGADQQGARQSRRGGGTSRSCRLLCGRRRQTPERITMALDLRDLYGPEVDEALGGQEPHGG